MQSFPDDWSLLDRINYLQRKIILNSILYYEYNLNSLDDHFYDNMCKQLVKLQFIYSRRGDIKKDTTYGYIYYDFDGSTGYHLYNRLNLKDRSYLLAITDLHVNNKKGRGV